MDATDNEHAPLLFSGFLTPSPFVSAHSLTYYTDFDPPSRLNGRGCSMLAVSSYLVAEVLRGVVDWVGKGS